VFFAGLMAWSQALHVNGANNNFAAMTRNGLKAFTGAKEITMAAEQRDFF